MPLFDIILPTYNNLAELQRCLQSLARQTFADFRTIICIDGSTDGTAEFLQRDTFPFPVVITQHPDGKNHGRNPTRNLSLPYISAEYLLFLDSDVELRPDCLQRHIEALTDRDCISVGDVQYTNAGENYWADYLQTRGKNKYADGSEIPPQYFITQNAAHRSRYFTEAGGQDGTITKYGGGDTEYALRLHKLYNLPTIFNAKAAGDSAMNKTLPEALNQMELFGATNLKYLAKKYPENKAIFGLDILEGKELSSKLRRFILNYSTARIVEKILGVFPAFLRRKAIHVCVAARIKRGYFMKVKQ